MTPVWVTCLLIVCHLSVCGADKSGGHTTNCFECMNYGPDGKFYDQCPMHGPVDAPRAYLGNCTGKCFTHTDDLNKKLVVRGCTASQWGLPNPLPPDGCYPWYSELWCVCSTDGCNKHKLGKPTTDKQFDYQVDYSKPNAPVNNRAPSSTSLLPLLPLTALCCLVRLCSQH